MSDEVLIQTIRASLQEEVAGLEPPGELLEQIPAPRQRWWLPATGWLGPALAVGVAAVVAVVAVTSLSHRSPSPSGGSSAVTVAARGLVSRLAVLRRSQRPSDLLHRLTVREIESLTYNAKVITGLTRLVGSVNLDQFGRARVYVVVQAPPRFPVHKRAGSPPLLSPRLGDQASIVFVGPFREEAAINHPSVAAGATPVAATQHGLTEEPNQVNYLWRAVAGIVPDGVNRVKWVFTQSGSGSKPITVWPRVRSNVALTRLPTGRQVFLSRAVWYGADGRVRASFPPSSDSSAKATSFKRALEASLHQRTDPALLRHFALLRMKAKAVPRLTRAQAVALIEPNPLGLNLGRARFVDHAPTAVFVIPGAQGVALRWIFRGSGRAEAGTSLALDGGLFIESARVAGQRTVIGLAPDGNRTVKVLLRSGGVRTAPVVDSVYSIVVPASARTLVLKNAAGRTVRLRLA